MWIFVNITEEDVHFDQIYSSYCSFRINEKEFCRFKMVGIKEKGRNGVLLCDIHKVGHKWNIKARNYFTKETYLSDDVIPIIEKLLHGNSSDVRIIDVN